MQPTATVLMTADVVGGVWSYSLDLCGAMPDFRFVVASLGPRPSMAQRMAAARLTNVTLVESDFRLEWMTGGRDDIAVSRDWLARLARQYDADLIHVNGYAQVPPAGTLPSIAVAHSDVLSWWMAVHGEPAPAEWHDYRREVADALQRASCVVALTNAGNVDLQRHYGFSPRCVIAISNGIETGMMAAVPKLPMVFAAGRVWDEAKNLRLLDEIAPALPWPIEIAGNTTHPERGEIALHDARAVGLLDRDALRRHLASAAIYAAPALYEPFGLGILDAAAAGCALLLGDIPSLRENWHAAAILLPPGEPAHWRDAVLRLIDDGDERERLGKAAQEQARRFTLARMADRYRALYRSLISGRAPYRVVA